MRHLEKCHTASESVTETNAAVNSPTPAAAVAVVVAAFAAAVAVGVGFAVFGSVVGAGFVAAAVWPGGCQTEGVNYRTLWPHHLEGTAATAAVGV